MYSKGLNSGFQCPVFSGDGYALCLHVHSVHSIYIVFCSLRVAGCTIRVLGVYCYGL